VTPDRTIVGWEDRLRPVHGAAARLVVGILAVAVLPVCGEGSSSTSARRNCGSDRFVWAVDTDYRAFDIFEFDHGRITRLTNKMSSYQPQLSPDGTRIAYADGREGTNSEGDYTSSAIRVMNANGHGDRKLTSGPHDYSPTWSPDGRRIAFRRGGRVFVVRSDGGGLHPVLSQQPDNAYDDSIAWSPRGEQLVFRRQVGGGTTIWIAKADGEDAHALIPQPTQESSMQIAWSADGKSLYLEGEDAIFRHDLASGVDTTVVTGGHLPARTASGKLAYLQGEPTSFTLTVAEANGRSARTITADTKLHFAHYVFANTLSTGPAC